VILAADKLGAELARAIAPIYVVSGDDPLLCNEAADRIRAAARKRDFGERTVFTAERGFDWRELAAAGASMSLFAERRLLELRIPTGKPGTAGAEALSDYAASPPDDNLLLILTPRLDKSALRTSWIRALDAAGVVVQVWPLERRQLPRWIAARMKAEGLRPAPGAAELIADRVEGNLLAADQEIRKLALLLGEGNVSEEQVARAVTDSARFDVFGLVDAADAGDLGRSHRILAGLKGEGVEPVLVLWALARELRALAGVSWQLGQGGVEGDAMRRAGIWPRRQPLARRMLARHPLPALHGLLRQAASTDRVIKGSGPGRPWQALADLVTAMAGSSHQRQGRAA
jgi:DNA polymerase-3 subunit delta